MPDRIQGLEARMTRLENALPEWANDIKVMIRQEIQDLKMEQLTEIKSSIERVERAAKDDYLRLSEDGRRSWDAIRSLEKTRNEETGTRRVHSSITHGATLLGGGGISAFLTWLLTRH